MRMEQGRAAVVSSRWRLDRAAVLIKVDLIIAAATGCFNVVAL